MDRSPHGVSHDHPYCRLLFGSELRMEGQFCTEGMTELLGLFAPLLPPLFWVSHCIRY